MTNKELKGQTQTNKQPPAPYPTTQQKSSHPLPCKTAKPEQNNKQRSNQKSLSKTYMRILKHSGMSPSSSD